MQKANVDSSYAINFSVRISALILLFTSLLLSTAGQAAYTVGVIKFVYGKVNITSSTGETRKAEQDENLMKDELVITGPASIAVIQLNDDSRMTLRPRSRFRVTQMIMDGDDSVPSAVLNLLRGGLRLVTGLIGKVNPTGYRLNTPVATIGIRGTEFNTRVCGTDCAAEEKLHADGDAAAKIKEGLYVNVDDGQVFLQNFATTEPLNLNQGESGFVSDLNSAPEKLSFIPAFLSLDKIPSPSQLDFDDIDISDDELEEIEKAETEQTDDSVKKENVETADVDIDGDWETDEVEYGDNLPRAAQIKFFGNDADLDFSLNQKGNKFEGEFDGDRDGEIKGEIDGDKVTFTFLLEARRGELKEGSGFWIMQDDGTLKGEFQISDPDLGRVSGTWILERD